MAECIPDRLSAKASRGEERTFALLKKLPDDYLIYYEPNIDNRHPDFIGTDSLFLTLIGAPPLAAWASPGIYLFFF